MLEIIFDMRWLFRGKVWLCIENYVLEEKIDETQYYYYNIHEF